jgi:hypothetical protein
MRQHLLFRRKNRLKIFFILFCIAAIMIFYFIRNNHKNVIHCNGQINSVFGDNETTPVFSGIYTFMLDNKQGYISVNGIFNTVTKEYAVQRIIKVKVQTASNDRDFYDIKQISVQSLTGDNLPDELYIRYILNPMTVVTLDKTLRNSYLIRNLYSPVLICNPIN